MTSRLARFVWLGLLALLVPLALLTPAAKAADPQPTAVSVPGTFGSEVGCSADWQPDCDQVQLTKRSNDDIWSVSLALPAGSWEYKATLNKSFDVSYGLNTGAANIPLAVPAGGATVTFYYDNATHWVTADVSAPLVTAAGSFQSELGCPADFSPDCLRSWLEDPDGDGTYTFTTTAIPAGDYAVKAAVGLSWDVNYGAGGVPGGGNITFTVDKTGDPTTFSYDPATHVLTVTAGNAINLAPLRAYWLSRHYLAWAAAPVTGQAYALYAAPRGGLTTSADGVAGGTAYPLTVVPTGLPAGLKQKFPAQAGLTALRLGGVTTAKIRSLLRGQLAVVALDADGTPVAGSGLQIPGVIDDVYAGARAQKLGLSWKNGRPTLRLWAPTAKSVSVNVYRSGSNASTAKPLHRVALDRNTDGVWTVRGSKSWRNRYFLYDVAVYVPETGQVEHNLVTDPYSVGLSRNSDRSLLVDLDAKRLKPSGWDRLRKPKLAKPADQAITELHVRDFSVSDPTVPASHRGGFQAFADRSSTSVAYLRRLAKAGMTTVHLMPVNDIATVDEDKSTWLQPDCDLPSFAPDSEDQQACVKKITADDGFNWGYDPLHYTTPEGSYSTKPNGSRRTREFRDMVAALNHNGQRVVMDVVYNHTSDSGQAGRNDLDRIVPGYYHRLNGDGVVENSTCCSNTATEHAMMGKLMIDSVITWATAYKLDGFRFDLMGHQPKAVMVELRRRLDRLTVAKDGVDGKKIYLYGEGWNFGEVANDALFTQAIQKNLAGTGIGTFNDRLRDAVRGGGPFDADPRIQGFGSGLYTDPNGVTANGSVSEQLARLRLTTDQIKVGLTGNLKDYRFTDHTGATVTGADIPYGDSPTGYTSQPAESINYVDAHDNETLYDALTYKLPVSTPMADRIRMQTLSLSTTAFSQGVSFWLTGSDALRSKSFDGNSYDSGDWFNVLDTSLQDNGFGRGLSLSSDAKWPYAKPLLADPALKPTPVDLKTAEAQSQALLEIRQSSPLLRLGSAARIQQKLSFPNSGPTSTPGVIVMRLDDTVGKDIDPRLRGMVVVFNATPQATSQTVSATQGQTYALHRVQQTGSDPVVKQSTYTSGTGSFTVPARTVAVFVRR